MKTKISGAIISILCMFSCGTVEKPKEAEAPQSNKMILKASNNMYVVMAADSILMANQLDVVKAEVFEKITQENGKVALKTSFRKFVSDDRNSGNKLFANRNTANDWEQFEIITLDGGKINLKSSVGKFVCGDQGLGGVLVANRDQASDWETFTVEQR